MLRIGIDVGGTFTDLVAVDPAGRSTLAKSASTPPDPSVGVLNGLGLLAEALGMDLPAMLAGTERIVHGTTVATNALLEHKGARVGLLTTEGHRDVIEMREGLKDDRYNLRMPPPVQLVPRDKPETEIYLSALRAGDQKDFQPLARLWMQRLATLPPESTGQ